MDHMKVKESDLKKKKFKEWGSFNLISSQFKIARIPKGQFSKRILLLKLWPMDHHQLTSEIRGLSGPILDLQN